MEEKVKYIIIYRPAIYGYFNQGIYGFFDDQSEAVKQAEKMALEQKKTFLVCKSIHIVRPYITLTSKPISS